MSSRRLLCLVKILVSITAIGLTCKPGMLLAQRDPPPKRYTFEIDPEAASKDLLPTPPKTPVKPASCLNEDLWEVPELTIGEPVAGKDTEQATAHVLAKINHLNQQDPDGFLKALAANRADLRGLPYLLGKDCRTEVKQAQLFTETVAVVQQLLLNIAREDPETASVPNKKLTMEIIRREFSKTVADKGRDVKTRRSQASQNDFDRANVAALMQMFAAKPALYRAGLAEFLGTIQHVDATHALAKLVMFAGEESVQKAAIEGLKGRPTKDCAPILVQGLRYPLPVASTRAADALVQLQCKDALAGLVDVLDQPDPRAPMKQKIDGKEVTVVRELVRVNHHRNCLLCHAPANAEGMPRDVLTVPVPLPDQLLPSQVYYGPSRSPDIFVRTDITYLRQDFTMMMRVEKVHPWPELQRFDFLVRTRVLSAEEAAECNKELAQQRTPPSHIAAQHALRELTGRAPAEPTPQAWRRLLKSVETRNPER
jgi:hypothetical protein